jgi:outer membrane receptor for ferrienterochelin and colicin
VKQTNKTWQVIAAVSAAVAASANAIAAEQGADVLEEIVVTAQFREQNLQDTPIAITAVNAEMLEARSQTNIAQVAAQAPNVSLRPQPAGAAVRASSPSSAAWARPTSTTRWSRASASISTTSTTRRCPARC